MSDLVNNQRALQQRIFSILSDFRGINPLKDLFWDSKNYLGYVRVNEPLSRRGWTETAAKSLAEDPNLFATGGEDNRFHVIYGRIAHDRLPFGMERPVVTHLLRDHPTSLFIFSNYDQTLWHFLNVKYDTDVGRRQLFRRITIGPDERHRTASERIALIAIENIPRDLFGLSSIAIQNQHDVAFDVEVVTKQFFKVFADLYLEVAADIAKERAVEKEAGWLAQLLLDRMLFLYFIQKKGWLDGKRNYLYSRFMETFNKDRSGHSYYSNILYPLFTCLSNPDWEIDTVGSVPFLNGGLFEEESKLSQTNRIQQALIRVKNSTFNKMFDVLLERFNFTVTEDTNLDMEVAIDPEMLGKIFENLILQLEIDPNKDLRKMTGSYYTPRPIVHFMCQEALKEYLVSQLAKEDIKELREKIRELISLPPADQLDDHQISRIKSLFTESDAKILRHAILNCRVCDPAVGSGAFPVGMLHEMVAAIGKIDVLINGMASIRRRNYDYDLKKQIIETCLYGVDIQDQAVKLCELRLWLSLVVDYHIDSTRPFDEAIREVPCLPNLSFRIIRGDSLLENLFGHTIKLDQLAKDPRSKQIIESIQADKQSYFREGKIEEKRRLELKIFAKQAQLAEKLVEAKKISLLGKEYTETLFGEDTMTKRERIIKSYFETKVSELEELKSKVTKAKAGIEKISSRGANINREEIDLLRRKYFQVGDSPTFIWRLDFAEVFTEKGGFDIVIGNPPYAGFHGLSKNYKSLLKENYECASGRFDFYMPFIENGLNILRPNYRLFFICPSSFLKRDGGTALRELISKKYGICEVVDFGHSQIFEDATNYTGVFSFSTNQPNEFLVHKADYDGNKLMLAGTKFKSNILRRGYSFWFFPTGPAYKIWADLEAGEYTTLGSISKISEGVVTGKNDVFLINLRTIERLGIEKGIVYPCSRGSEIHPYYTDMAREYLIYPYDKKNGKVIPESVFKLHYPSCYKYLSSKRDDLYGRGYFERSKKLWYELWNERKVENLMKEKIVVSELGDRNSFAISEANMLYGDTVCGIILNKKDISLYAALGILNSKLMTYYFKQLSVPKAGGFVIYKPLYLKEIPVLNLSKKDDEVLKSLVSEYLNEKWSEGSKQIKILKEIDHKVYDLYRMKDSDISKIEGY